MYIIKIIHQYCFNFFNSNSRKNVFVTFVDYHRYLCYQGVYLAHSVNDVLDDTLQNHDGSHNFSVRKWILDHNSEYCGHRSKYFHKSNTSF